MNRRTWILTAILIAACDNDPAFPPPPVGSGSATSSTLPTSDESSTGDEDSSSTGDPEVCPWDGTCAELEDIDECDGWAIACGDGWRCVDTELEAGIVCEADGSSSSGAEEEWIYEDHVSPCFELEAESTGCHEYCDSLEDEAAPSQCNATNLWECAYSQVLDECSDPIEIPGGVSQCDEPMETPAKWRCLCARNPDNPCHP